MNFLNIPQKLALVGFIDSWQYIFITKTIFQKQKYYKIVFYLIYIYLILFNLIYLII